MLRALSLAGFVSAFGLRSAFGLLGRGAAEASVDGSDLRFTGSFSGSSAHNLATGEFHSVWTGEASHFGISNLENQAQITFTGPTSLRYAGTWTLTAANGDRLFGTAAGTGIPTDPTHITLLVDCTATGGTGRFGRATATFRVEVHHTRTALEDGISYGEQQATLEGQMSWSS